MDIPVADALADPNLREKAAEQAARLEEELKKSVQTQTRDIGRLRKELRITVPAKVISAHLDQNFSDIAHDAVVPGFRKGRAPRALVQRRFGAEVRDSLKTAILGQSFFAAVEKEKLEVLGDPLFQVEMQTGGTKLMDFSEAMAELKLSDQSDFTYTCEIEIKPSFELPELKGIEIKVPDFKIGPAQVDEYIERQRKIRGRYEPVSGAAADKEDLLIADVTLKVDGAVVKTEENLQLGVRPSRLDGIPLMNLDQVLALAKVSDERSCDCQIPDDYERADLRGKAGRFEFKIHEIKRLVPISVETYREQTGAESDADLRRHVQEELEAELDVMTERAKKAQVQDYLLAKVPLDLPEQLSARQTDRAVMRRVIELQQRGVPLGEIEARIDELRTSAREDVSRELKLEFILEKVAEKLEVDVTDEEVNTEIARMARLYNRRFDRVRDDLQKQALLPQLATQIRYDKCIGLLLQDARLVASQGDAEAEPAKRGGRGKARKAE